MTRYNRRTLLKASAAFAGASALGFPAIVRAQADKVRIGHLTPLTGFLGALGAPVNPGVTTSTGAVFLGRVVRNGVAGASFRPHLGCIPASGGGHR